MGVSIMSKIFYPLIIMAILMLTWGFSAAGSKDKSRSTHKSVM
jgi:hypothetical protein